jgi:hypothetical protein
MKAAVMRYVTALGMVGALTMNASLARHRNQLGSRHTTNMNMAQYCLPKENDPDQTKIYCWQDEGQIIAARAARAPSDGVLARRAAAG